MSTSLDYIYRYEGPSRVSNDPDSVETARVILSADREFSFLGTVREPVLFADSLLCLSSAVRSNFAYPGPGLLDPVVTCMSAGVRFEGFSGCCGAYVHAKFSESMFEDLAFQYGTTNVDINDEFRNGLSRVRQTRSVRLSVNQGELSVSHGEHTYAEKKVKLPLRWLRGFCEIQTMLSRVEHRMSVSAREALKFIQGLPRNAARQQPLWATPSGRGLRASTRSNDKAVAVAGTDRLRLLEPLLRAHDGTVSIGRIPGEATSSWFCDFGGTQFLLVLSPGIYRGFSGEGQVLDQLADPSWRNAIDQVRTALDWEHPIDAETFANKLNLDPREVTGALAALATRGVLGFDLHEQQYFYRQLPFDSHLVESLQPRLIAAQKIVDENLITPCNQGPGGSRWTVKGTDVEHIVTLAENRSTCTCVWFNKHQGSRGPCKHILAATIRTGNDL